MRRGRQRPGLPVLAVVAALMLVACGQWQPAGDGGAESLPGVSPEAPGQDEVGASPGPAPTGDLQVHFIDVGQGDATLLVGPDATVLVDAGRHTAGDVVDYLDRHGVTAIDVVAITHPHADHIGQFDQVMEHRDVAEVWWSPSTHTTQTFDRALAALESSDAVYEEPRAGDHTEVGGLRFEFVNPPPGGGSDLHDASLAFRVTYGDTTFLFTGDAEEGTEQRMAADHAGTLAADVYQVGHHGSSTSTSQAFLAAVAPQVAVYSAGQGNPYGHPHAEVVDRLAGTGVALYGTDVHGTVVVTTNGTDLRVESATGDPAITRPEGSR